jgi:hypothetical protein
VTVEHGVRIVDPRSDLRPQWGPAQQRLFRQYQEMKERAASGDVPRPEGGLNPSYAFTGERVKDGGNVYAQDVSDAAVPQDTPRDTAPAPGVRDYATDRPRPPYARDQGEPPRRMKVL